MNRHILLFLLLLFSATAGAQNFIGLNERKVKRAMATEKPMFSLDERRNNDKYRFLRYQSDDETETWIIFFDEEGLCKGVRVTCDTIYLDQKRKEFNQLYTLTGDDSWTNSVNDQQVNIDLRNEKWFLTITYTKIKN